MGLRTVELVAGLLLVACSSGSPPPHEMMMKADDHNHMAYTAPRPGSAADTARALDVVHRLRAATARYSTVASAEAAGYESQAHGGMQQRHMLHLSRPGSLAGTAGFDPGTPQSLLYRQDETGQLHLAGAMFVAPKGSTERELDAMVPLSVARWHRHVDVCRGPNGEADPRYHQYENQAACAKAGGRWRPASRYMLHIMIDAGDSVAAAFPQRPDLE
jgi:hypothetical protein